jgi:hypothetical protein
MSLSQELRQRVRDYLGNGGLFNPELMEHDKVRSLLLDVADALDAQEAEIARLRDEVAAAEEQKDAYASGVAEGMALHKEMADKSRPTCATCQHYSGEHCADTRPGGFLGNPMKHQMCAPSFGCNQWEAQEP